ncbi:tail fiber assembly protein [Achromobacter xylosoxidans]|uniref:tail fiber assembly protein n=1 Tax=Alcaligenes xylosoxydans xylosoxydans TaxID=85698 RepID=UPI0027957DB6|nr:tail fiber assembly protein [Achromobacter xylosoxidans]
MEKIVSQLDQGGYFLGPTVAHESPLEPGVFLIPGGAIDEPPPEVIEPGMAYSFTGDAWLAVEDHRNGRLYLTADGADYRPGADGPNESAPYTGIGPMPDWLTSVARPDAWSVWRDGGWIRDETAWAASQAAALLAEKRARLLAASDQISVLQDAVDLGIATDDESAMLVAWKRYRVELNRIAVPTGDSSPITWPVPPA